jgi:carbon storage regulator
MLVLSRQRDETIMIGDDIEITIVDIRGDKVRLGINAPREVQVHRKEVYEAIRRENTEASQVRVTDLPALERNAKRADPGRNNGQDDAPKQA